MSYTPPFTITTDILNLVANISQQVGMLEVTMNAPINVTINMEADIAGKVKRIGSNKTGHWEIL